MQFADEQGPIDLDEALEYAKDALADGELFDGYDVSPEPEPEEIQLPEGEEEDEEPLGPSKVISPIHVLSHGSMHGRQAGHIAPLFGCTCPLVGSALPGPLSSLLTELPVLFVCLSGPAEPDVLVRWNSRQQHRGQVERQGGQQEPVGRCQGKKAEAP